MFVAAVVVLVCACPNRTPSDPTHPRGSNAQPDGSVAGTDATEPDNCEGLVAHAIGIYLGELSQTTPADQLPTPDEIAKLTAELRADPACREFSRPMVECALAAKTLAEYGDCRPEQ